MNKIFEVMGDKTKDEELREADQRRQNKKEWMDGWMDGWI
jgi:hypothetical protein